MLRHGAVKLLVAGALAAMTTAAPAAPATAAGSAPAKVTIEGLSGPSVGPGGELEYTLEVTARDPDGLITEVTVELTGRDYRSVTWASRPCFLFPEGPGDPVRMQIPQSVPGPGAYMVRVHAHSTPSCGSEEEQAGPPTVRRFVVPA